MPNTQTKPRLIEHGKNWKTYPPEWTQRIERIAAIQAQLQDTKALGLDWSDKQFTKDLTIKNVWPSMRLGLYPLPSTATTNTKWLRELDVLESHAKSNLKRQETGAAPAQPLTGYVERKDYQAIKAALERAKKQANDQNPDRVVGYVAETGCGKTAMIKRLIEARVVDWSMESAPSSFKAFMQGLAAMWDLPIAEKTTIDELKDAILKHAKTLPGIFILDEIDTLDRRSLVLVKQLLNESMMVIGLFMTPETYEGLKRMTMRKDKQGSQLKQIFRRFEALICASKIEPKEIATLAPEAWSNASPEQLERVALEANRMGGIDAVKRIGSNVIDLSKGTTQTIPTDIFEKAVKLYRTAVPYVHPKQARMEGRAA